MKFSKLGLLVILIINSIAFSCTNGGGDDSPSPNNVTNVLSQGDTWKVTYFWDKTKDETHKFANYTFVFENNGELRAFRSGDFEMGGTWSVSSSSNKLILNLGQTAPLDELTDDWLIIEKTDSKIKLKDDNDEHLEELHFEKI